MWNVQYELIFVWNVETGVEIVMGGNLFEECQYEYGAVCSIKNGFDLWGIWLVIVFDGNCFRLGSLKYCVW